MSINISELNRDLLLQALWEKSLPASFFRAHKLPAPAFDLEMAKQQLHTDGYADYICGRVIKTNIYESDTIDPRLYDRDNGIGAFEQVVNSLRMITKD